MKIITLVISSILVIKLSAASSDEQLFSKRGCVPIGGACETRADCCGSDHPDYGHCLLCTHGLFSRKRHCGCDVTGSVSGTLDGVILTDRCDGRDSSNKDRCRTRVAPPGHRYYRGKTIGKV